VGELIHRPKSSVHRHLQAQARRNRHPESGFWETEEGEAWLRLLVFAVLYTFGLQHHVGAGALSDFFQLIRLHTHVGVSPSALQTQLSRMEALLPLFQQQCEASVPTRTQVTPRLEALGIEVNHAISDRAKALIKLAVTGFECTSGADTFHEQYGLSRWLSPALGRRKAKADQCCELAQKALDQPSRGASTEEKAALAAQQACAWEARAQVEQAQQEYQKQLLGIAEEIHPFSLEENTRTTAESVVAGLETRAQALETLAAQQGIQDTRSALKKFRAQIGALSSHVSFWWLWVEEILLGWSLDEATRQWLTSKLLPVLYWHYQMRKTQNRVHRKRYQEAWQRALEAWKADPFHSGFSESELQRWLEWGEWMVRQFHRSSSAVEGRNGRLSQLYHNGRGLTKCRLAALTVIHNYGVRRSDGTIAAERLFSTSFPDLFDWLLNQIPLKLEIVPA
jgi:phage baseplate assembly protein W